MEAVERAPARLAQRGAPRIAVAQAPGGRDRPVQDDDVDVGAGVARGERLAVRPDAEHRVVGARVELRDDADLHASTRPAAIVRTSSRATYGRSREERRASAAAASRG